MNTALMKYMKMLLELEGDLFKVEWPVQGFSTAELVELREASEQAEQETGKESLT